MHETWKTWVPLWVGKIPWRRAWQPTPVFLPGQSPWTEEPGGLQSMWPQRVRNNWSDLAGTHRTRPGEQPVFSACWWSGWLPCCSWREMTDSVFSCRRNFDCVYRVSGSKITLLLDPNFTFPLILSLSVRRNWKGNLRPVSSISYPRQESFLW